MLLAFFHPHDDLAIKVRGGQSILWPMDRPSHLSVLTEALGDAFIGVRLGWVLGVLVDGGRRLALVGHSPCLELSAWLVTM
jgi:hypothetical protein